VGASTLSYLSFYTVTDVPYPAMEFQHRPLRESGHEIRLVKVRPESHSQNIEVTLEHIDFSEALVYRAVSYTWGLPEPVQTIKVNGQDMIIRDNLWQFLQAYRESSQYEPQDALWIDQLCIDQSSIQERNQQVRYMGQLFCTARSTIIWLGSATNSSDNALEFFERWQTVKNQVYNDTGSQDGANCPGILSSQQHRMLAKIHAHNLRDVLDRDYWSRLWIIQEILLSNDITILCGSKCISWDIFDTFLRDVQDIEAWEPLKRKRVIDKSDGQDIEIDWSPWKFIVRHENHPWTAKGLFTMLSRYLWAECEDERDLVFGLQGLIHEWEQIKVDYSMTMKAFLDEVFKKIAESYMREHGGTGRGLPSEYVELYVDLEMRLRCSTKELGPMDDTAYLWLEYSSRRGNMLPYEYIDFEKSFRDRLGFEVDLIGDADEFDVVY
jgi:hypothetical protein